MLLILGLDILISLEKKQILTGEKFNQSIDRLRLVYEPEISVANVECKKEHSQAHGQTAEYVCHIDDRQLQPLDFVFVYRVVGHFFLSNTRRYSPLLYEYYRKQLELANKLFSPTTRISRHCQLSSIPLI